MDTKKEQMGKKTARQRDSQRVANEHSDELVFEMLNKMSAYATQQFKATMRQFEISYINQPQTAGIQGQSVSNGAPSRGSETEQQRQSPFRAIREQKRRELNSQLNQNNYGLQEKTPE